MVGSAWWLYQKNLSLRKGDSFTRSVNRKIHNFPAISSKITNKLLDALNLYWQWAVKYMHQIWSSFTNYWVTYFIMMSNERIWCLFNKRMQSRRLWLKIILFDPRISQIPSHHKKSFGKPGKTGFNSQCLSFIKMNISILQNAYLRSKA
jgi:hypothetical protein